MPFKDIPTALGDVSLNSVTLTGAGPSTKKLYLSGNNFLTLLNSDGSKTDMSVDSGGTVAARGNVVAFGDAANSVTLDGAATGGNVLLGVTPGSAGPNLGAVLGNIRGTGALMAQVPLSDYVLTAAVLAGGTGYSNDDILTVVGGTGSSATVSATVSSGVVTGVTLVNSGAYSVQPGATPATTGGTGSGCTLTLTYAVTGSARGNNAVDWQTTRSALGQVASGNNSVIAGGLQNTAAGNYSFVCGSASTVPSTGVYGIAMGRSCTADANSSMATGQAARTHGIIGARVHSGNSIAGGGDAQLGEYVLMGRSTGGAAVRLTADGGSVGPGFTTPATPGSANVCNLPNNTAWGGYCNVITRDTTAGSVNGGHWRAADAFIIRGATTATTVVPSFSLTFVGTGTSPPVSGNLVPSADTTNGGLNLTFTPPSAAVTTGSSISGTTLTLGAVSSGTVAVGQTITGTGVIAGTTIVSGSGLSWVVSVSHGTVVATTITMYVNWDVVAVFRTAEVQ